MTSAHCTGTTLRFADPTRETGRAQGRELYFPSVRQEHVDVDRRMGTQSEMRFERAVALLTVLAGDDSRAQPLRRVGALASTRRYPFARPAARASERAPTSTIGHTAKARSQSVVLTAASRSGLTVDPALALAQAARRARVSPSAATRRPSGFAWNPRPRRRERVVVDVALTPTAKCRSGYDAS